MGKDGHSMLFNVVEHQSLLPTKLLNKVQNWDSSLEFVRIVDFPTCGIYEKDLQSLSKWFWSLWNLWPWTARRNRLNSKQTGMEKETTCFLVRVPVVLPMKTVVDVAKLSFMGICR